MNGADAQPSAFREMKEIPEEPGRSLVMSRREFLIAAATAGSAALVGISRGQGVPVPKPDPLHIALVGAGVQGRVLLESCLRIPGIHIRAVCDIWEYSRTYATRFVSKYGHEVKGYENYRELLDSEIGLDAVLVASPDWMHAEQTNACLEAGLHVYCEGAMSHSLEGARSMVRAARSTERLLQIGLQRRSNLRYIHAIDTLVRDARLLGRVTHAQAQWNRSVCNELMWPGKHLMPQSKLEEYGYESMHHLRNWQWYPQYGGGPLSSLGTQQIDVLNWVFGPPVAVVASGGTDYYQKYRNPDNVLAIFDYATPEGTARAIYRLLSTTSRGRFSEEIMGVNGSIGISEVCVRGNAALRESHAPDWQPYAEKGWLETSKEVAETLGSESCAADVRSSRDGSVPVWPLPASLSGPPHQMHLENFFDAIRKGTPLTCPAEKAFETAATVAKVYEALNSGCKLRYERSDFVA